MKYLSTILFLLPILLLSCSKDDDGDARHQEEVMIIEQYLLDNQLKAERTESDLHYIITEEGTGGHPSPGASVRVHYKGYLLDGTVFDSSLGGSAPIFSLSGVIPGWQEGIPKLRRGGSGILIIPSRLGYGDRALTDIPANSILIFEVDLIDF